MVAGVFISYTDIRDRTVPRWAVAAGTVCQLAFVILWCVRSGDPSTLWSSLGFAVASGVAQLALALVRPGALGLGDVTATTLMGTAAGAYGPGTVALWWLLMGSAGLSMLWVQRRRGKGSIPFAPAVVGGAMAAVALAP